jgi:hypothetical protein
MTLRQVSIVFMLFLALSILTVPAWAHGTKVVPHVVDGSQSDGIGYRTKFDFTNLGPTLPVTKISVSFYKTVAGGAAAPWTVATNQGSQSSFVLSLGALQTIRLETTGLGNITDGYAVISSQEDSTVYSDDYEIGVTVYFEVLDGSNVIDTVSVPLGLPTVSFTFPFEIDLSKGLNTGLALVNLANAANSVTLQLYRATTPSATNLNMPTETVTIAMDAGVNKKIVQFLDQSPFKSMSQLGLTQFKGTAVCVADGPVSVLTLLQTQAQSGVQFATLVPAYNDSLRRNTFLYFPQGYALDADLPVVDYWQTEFSNADAYLNKPWDLLFQSQDKTNLRQRYLVPQQGAILAKIGIKTDGEFDKLSLSDIQNAIANNPASRIDLSDGAQDLVPGLTFALKTGIGRYAKALVWTYVAYSDSGYKDLLVKIYVYK